MSKIKDDEVIVDIPYTKSKWFGVSSSGISGKTVDLEPSNNLIGSSFIMDGDTLATPIAIKIFASSYSGDYPECRGGIYRKSTGMLVAKAKNILYNDGTYKYYWLYVYDTTQFSLIPNEEYWIVIQVSNDKNFRLYYSITENGRGATIPYSFDSELPNTINPELDDRIWNISCIYEE